MKRKTIIICMLSLWWLGVLHLPAQNGKIRQNIRDLVPQLTLVPPKLDGVLDDEAWKSGPQVDDNWITYNPVDGNLLPQKTIVYMAYDPDNLYFGFHCKDTEPDKIKTSLTKRDKQWEDDWVGFSLDAVGSKQYGYDFFVNPNGVQGDIYRSGDREETSTDWVWYSAGRLVEDGYTVEIKVPLKNIRYTSGENVKMGILFWRRISRLGVSGSWPELVPGKGVLNSLTNIIYEKLDSQLKLEALPSFTFGSIWDRESPINWSSADTFKELGISAKYGITSSITAEATINPDFSQVESDEFQVEVNQRYPIFYSEKRPFFMELGNIFSMAGTGGASNIWIPVHTRNIVDPDWGIKLTGELSKASFGFLATSDGWPGRSWQEEEENPDLGENAYSWVGRGKYSLGGDNFIGTLYSGQEFGDNYNRVIGADLSLRFWKNHSFQSHYLHTFSNQPDEKGKSNGGAFTALYNYYTRSFSAGVRLEHFDEDFRMDNAFYMRTGYSKVRILVSPNFFPSEKKYPWFKRFNPYILGEYLHDGTSGLKDYMLEVGTNFNFTLGGSFGFGYTIAREGWQGTEYDWRLFSAYGTIQLFKWLRIHTCTSIGNGIYYDEEDPFMGNTLRIHSFIDLQPNDKINLFLENVYGHFNRKSNGERVYDYNILRTRLTYQFNKFLFVRGLVQLDSYQKVVLSDLLASFTLIPGTVLHLGYGGLHEKQRWNNNKWDSELGHLKYYQTRQSLFFKVSYRFQF